MKGEELMMSSRVAMMWAQEEMIHTEVPVCGWNQERGQSCKFGSPLRRELTKVVCTNVSEALLDPTLQSPLSSLTLPSLFSALYSPKH